MRVKVRLLLAEIAHIEKIEPEAEIVVHELSHALEHYPKADHEALRANSRIFRPGVSLSSPRPACSSIYAARKASSWPP